MGICCSKPSGVGSPYDSSSADGASHSTARSDSGASDRQWSALISTASGPAATASEPAAMAPRVALGTSPNTLQQRRGVALQRHEMQQLAYLIAAMMTGDPVRSPARITAAGQTVHDVRLLLRHGRGNVHADGEPSHGHNVVGARLAYRGLDRDNQMALAGALGAGFCDQFARLAAVSHAPHLRDGESVVNAGGEVEIMELNADHTISATRTGHAWNELRRGNGRDGETTIVQDGWSNGPAVRLKDSAWANVQVEGEDLSIDKDGALWLKDRVERLIPLVHPDEDEYTAGWLEELRRNPTQQDRFLETQVVSAEFAAKAREALEQIPREQQEQLVSMAAQEFYGLSPHEAGAPHFIHSVLEQVGLLDHQDRPPVVPPDY